MAPERGGYPRGLPRLVISGRLRQLHTFLRRQLARADRAVPADGGPGLAGSHRRSVHGWTEESQPHPVRGDHDRLRAGPRSRRADRYPRLGRRRPVTGIPCHGSHTSWDAAPPPARLILLSHTEFGAGRLAAGPALHASLEAVDRCAVLDWPNRVRLILICKYRWTARESGRIGKSGAGDDAEGSKG